MKILIVTADYPPIEGGISTLTRQTAIALGGLGHSVTVIAPYFPGMDDFDRSETVTVVRYRGYGLGWLRVVPLLSATRARMGWADIILGMNIGHGGFAAWLLKGFSHTPYIAFAYAYEFLRFQRVALVGSFLRNVYNDSAFVVAISSFTSAKLAEFGVPKNHIRTILPGAPEAMYLDESVLKTMRDRYLLDGKRIVLAVGRFIERKNHAQLVRALPSILAKHPDTVLVMAGRGPEMPTVAREAHRLGLRDRIRLPGRLSDRDLAALYTLCDVFALPTGTAAGGNVEGFGIVFSEAHAYGKPVVAGRSGGTEDAVIDGKTGLLVDATDTAGLADAINQLLSDEDLARRLGEAGKERVEGELNWQHFAAKLATAMEGAI